jgi:2-(1,2-epoxy-1,2-dihydrophenyl)acetyl-CoA isomerase
LAAAADLIIARDKARVTLPYTRLGLTPDGGTSLLTSSIGLHQALRLALLNPVLTAEKARAFGLVAEVHPDDKVDVRAKSLVGELLVGSRTAQVSAKQPLRTPALTNPENGVSSRSQHDRACRRRCRWR